MKKLLYTSFLLVSFIGFGQCPTSQIVLTSQAQVDAFATNYPGCTDLLADFIINGNDITDLSGLSQLIGSTSRILILDNASLVNASDLSLVVSSSLGRVFIWDNPVLTILPNFMQGTPEDLDIEVLNNPSLLNLNGFLGLTSIRNISIVNSDSLVNLAGLDNITFVNTISIGGNDALQSISELGGFSGNVNGMVIFDNPLLVNLYGLEGILDTGEVGVFISDNESLLNLDGLQNLSGGHGLFVRDNDAIQSLEGLNSVIDFSEIEIENNVALVDISNLETNLASNIDHLIIKGNPNLATCNLLNICSYLDDNGDSIIMNNAPGCNTVQEVRTSCGLSVAEIVLVNTIVLYPNPVSEILLINASEGISVQGTTVYSILGEQLFESSEKSIDVSSLSEGIYFVEISTVQGTLVKRIIKE